MDPHQYQQPHTPHQIPTPPHDSPVDEKLGSFKSAFQAPNSAHHQTVNYPTMTTSGVPSVQQELNSAFHHDGPTLNSNTANDTVNDTAETAKSKIPDTIAGYKVPDAVKNMQVPESVKNMQVPEAVKNMQVPPAVQNAANRAQAEYGKTADEFSSLSARVPGPSSENQPEQYLTHFHTFFYDLFTWKFPRATGMTFGGVLTLIIASGYVNILRYVFKALYLLFAGSAVLEFAGKPLGMQGFVSQMRPKHYLIVPRDAIDSVFAELHELLNFFVLEFQRLIFAENIFATITAFAASFIGYVAVKYVSAWTLLLASTVIAFLAPLVYLSNQEMIDAQVREINKIANEKLTVARNASEKYATEAAQQARMTAAQLQERAMEITGQAKEKINVAIPKAQQAVANAQQSAAQTYQNATQNAQQTYQNATQSAMNATSAATERVKNVTGKVANQPASAPTPVNVTPARDSQPYREPTEAVGSTTYVKESDFPSPPSNVTELPTEREREPPMAL